MGRLGTMLESDRMARATKVAVSVAVVPLGLVVTAAAALLACSPGRSDETRITAPSAAAPVVPSGVKFEVVPKWERESVAYDGSGYFVHMAVPWDETPKLAGWRLEPRGRPQLADGVKGTCKGECACHPLQWSCATRDARWSWRQVSDGLTMKNSRLLLDNEARRIQRMSLALIPRHGSDGTEYGGQPVGYWTRSSPAGRFLYVQGIFQYDGRELSFAIYDLDRRSWRPDIARLAVETQSSVAFASGPTKWFDLALNPDETLAAAKPCRRSLAFPTAQGLRSSQDHSEDCGREIELVSTDTGKVVRTLPTTSTAEHIAWSPNGKRLATSSPVTVWDVESGERLATVADQAVQVAWVDAARLVTADATGVHIRDARTLKLLQQVHAAGPLSVTVDRRSPSAGAIIALIVVDQRVMLRLYRVRDGAVLNVWGDDSRLIWFADDGAYDFEGQGDELAGLLSRQVRARQRDWDLWSRFWTGGSWTARGKPAAAASGQGARPASTEGCDPRVALCSYTGKPCPPGRRLNSEDMTCVP